MDEQLVFTDVKTCKQGSKPSPTEHLTTTDTHQTTEHSDPLDQMTPVNYWDHPLATDSVPPAETKPVNPSSESQELDDAIVFTGKKKKKKAVATPDSAPVVTTPQDRPTSPRPKLTISIITTVEGEIATEPQADDLPEIIQFTGTMKKKKKPAATKVDPIVSTTPEPVEADYSYEYLLGRLYGMMQAPPKVPKRISLVPPILGMIGTKRTCIANFAILCNGMNREPDHVSLYLQVEFSTNGSLSANNQLTLRGKFKLDQIQAGLTSYIARYVKCVNCKRYNTQLIKEERLSFLECLDCQAKRSVESVRPKKRVLGLATTANTANTTNTAGN